MELGEIVAKLRKHLGLTQSDLASRIGVKQNTISQYESGIASPSIEVLVELHKLAIDDPGTQNRIEEAIATRMRMAVSPEALAAIGERFRRILAERISRLSPEQWRAIHEFASAGERDATSRGPATARTRRFLKEATEIAGEVSEVPPALTEIMRLYRQHRDHPSIRKTLERMAHFMEIDLSTEPRRKRSQRPAK